MEVKVYSFNNNGSHHSPPSEGWQKFKEFLTGWSAYPLTLNLNYQLSFITYH
jgi:hypothetical protein